MARLEITQQPEGRGKPPLMAFKVVLSRRNLLALLHKVDMPGSARTITNDYIYMDGHLVGAGLFSFALSCEDDTEHYTGRVSPGEMHPDTETFIVEQEGGHD